MNQQASRYAEALLALGEEEGKLDVWQPQLKKIHQAVSDIPQMHSFFNSCEVTAQEKKEVLKKVFEGQLDREVMNFLLLLVDKKRMAEAGSIAEAFNILVNRKKNIENGTVYSASPLSTEQLHRIEEAIAAETGKKTELVNKLDKTLIMGVKVKVNDEVWDGTMKNRIQSMTRKLLEESR